MLPVAIGAYCMTWRGINNFSEPSNWFSGTQSGGISNSDPSAFDELFVRGSIVIEAELGEHAGSEQVLLDYSFYQVWQRSLKVYVSAAGDMFVDIIQGRGRSHGRLKNVSPGSLFRLTISWDGPERFGVVSLENFEDGSLLQAPINTPVPVPADDLKRIINLSGSPKVDPGVTLVAISDKVEKVGLNPSIANGSLITTADGPRPIERLCLGDNVLTESSGYQPIRWIIERTVPAYGMFAPIRLRTPYMGLTQDILVAPHQQMVMKGSSAEYLFGQESVMVRARDLVGHASACLESGQQTTTFYQIILDQHDYIEIGGAWGASQFLDRFDYPDEFSATNPLAHVPKNTRPKHQTPARAVLQSYETTSLLSALTA